MIRKVTLDEYNRISQDIHSYVTTGVGKKFACNACNGSEFTTITKAKEHIGKIHCNIAYKCPHSGCQHFTTWNNLGGHIKTKHMDTLFQEKLEIVMDKRDGKFPQIIVRSMETAGN